MASEEEELKPDSTPEDDDKPKRGRPKGATDSKPRRKRKAKFSIAEATEGSLKMGGALLAMGGLPRTGEQLALEAPAMAAAFEELSKDYPSFAKAAEQGKLLKWLALGVPMFSVGQVAVVEMRERSVAAVAPLSPEEVAFYRTLPFACDNCHHTLNPPHIELPTICPSCGADAMNPVEPAPQAQAS